MSPQSPCSGYLFAQPGCKKGCTPCSVSFVLRRGNESLHPPHGGVWEPQGGVATLGLPAGKLLGSRIRPCPLPVLQTQTQQRGKGAVLVPINGAACLREHRWVKVSPAGDISVHQPLPDSWVSGPWCSGSPALCLRVLHYPPLPVSSLLWSSRKAARTGPVGPAWGELGHTDTHCVSLTPSPPHPPNQPVALGCLQASICLAPPTLQMAVWGP